jgi:ribosomal protein S27AE
MNKQKVQLKCEACGSVFEAFLEEMAQHNGRVVCPKCGQGCENVTAAIQNASTSH